MIDFHALERADQIRIRIRQPERFMIPTDMHEKLYRLVGDANGNAELVVQIDHMEFYPQNYVGITCYGTPVNAPNDWLQVKITVKTSSPREMSLNLLQAQTFPAWGISPESQNARFEQAMNAIRS